MGHFDIAPMESQTPFTCASSLEIASGPLGGGTLMLAAMLAIPLTFGLSGLGVMTLVGVFGRDATNCTYIS